MVAWPDALSGNGRMSRLRPRSNGLPSVRGSVQLAHAPRAVCGFVLLLAAALRSAPSRHNEVHLPGPARSGQVKPCLASLQWVYEHPGWGSVTVLMWLRSSKDVLRLRLPLCALRFELTRSGLKMYT